MSTVLGIDNDGATTFKNRVDSTAAFQLQNSGGIQLLNVDTSASSSNVITNPGFEINDTGWALLASGTKTRDTTQHYIGNASLKIVTTTTNDGVSYAYGLASNTPYNFSFYAKLDSASASFATMKVGYNDGSTNNDCLTAQTVVSGGWTLYSCSFTTGTTSGSPYVYIKQSNATAHTFYIDNAQLEAPSQIISNTDFEVDDSGWTTTYNSGFESRTTSEAFTGSASLQVDTSASSSEDGVTYQYSGFEPNTKYTIVLHAKLDSGSPTPTAFRLSRLSDTSQGANITTCQSQNLTAGTWTTYQCSFTTNSSTTSAGYISFTQTSNTDQYATVYLDDVTMFKTKSNYPDLGRVSLNGIINSPITLQSTSNSTTAFQIQTAAATPLLVADTLNGRIAIGQATATQALDVNGSINVTTGGTYKIAGTTICSSTGCTVAATSAIKNQTSNQANANLNISSIATGSITAVLKARSSQTADFLQVQTNGGSKLSAINIDGSLTANTTAASSPAVDTTTSSGINTTTIPLTTGSGFSDGNIIFVDNAGQDYYTRIVSGGGTATLTVSPAVSFDNGATVTMYVSENIGATTSDYTTQANRFFQGYFAGGIVVGSDGTTLSDGRLYSTIAFNFNSSSYTFQPTSDSTTAFQIQNNAGTNLLTADSSNMVIKVSGTTSTFATLQLDNSHFKSTQTNAPTIGTPASCGTSPSSTVNGSPTDSAGSFTINSGTGSPTTCDTIFTFNKAYGAAPKSVILTANSLDAGTAGAYVSASGTTTFTVTLNTTAASKAYTFYYWVIE